MEMETKTAMEMEMETETEMEDGDGTVDEQTNKCTQFGSSVRPSGSSPYCVSALQALESDETPQKGRQMSKPSLWTMLDCGFRT